MRAMSGKSQLALASVTSRGTGNWHKPSIETCGLDLRKKGDLYPTPSRSEGGRRRTVVYVIILGDQRRVLLAYWGAGGVRRRQFYLLRGRTAGDLSGGRRTLRLDFDSSPQPARPHARLSRQLVCLRRPIRPV